MCVIIHSPKGTYLTKERAERLWKLNSDGGGYAFIDDDNIIQTGKSMEFHQFWKDFERARSEFPKRDFLIHMRIATHGTTDLANVHPFMVDPDTAMMHNGIFSVVPDYKDGRSDTAVFVDEVLTEMPVNWLDSYYLIDMMEDWIGYNKMAFLTTAPEATEQVVIINRTFGSSIDGMWFSNSSGVKDPTEDYAGYTSSRDDGGWKGRFKTGSGAVDKGGEATVLSPLARQRGFGKPSEEVTESLSGSGSKTPASSTPAGTTTTQAGVLTSGNRRYKWENGVLVPLTNDESDLSDTEFIAWLDTEQYEEVINSVKEMVETVDTEKLMERLGHSRNKDVIVKERKEEGNNNHIVYDPAAEKWSCMGCDEFLDFTTDKNLLPGDCACWEKMCTQCSRFAVMCTCNAGWVMDPIWLSEAESAEVAMAIDAYNDDMAPF